MKIKLLPVILLAASLSLGMAETSFARGGMGGSSGGRAAFGGSMGLDSGARGSFGSSRHGLNELSGARYGQGRNGRDLQHRDQTRTRYNNRNQGESGGSAEGTVKARASRQGDNMGAYGQQGGAVSEQGQLHRAVPATPAQPDGAGGRATSAIPATPAGK